MSIAQYLTKFALGVSSEGVLSAAKGGVPLRYIGCDYITNTFAGHIDDFRITKGYARYTSNFTPPAIAHFDK